MPTPRKHESHAARQAAYRARKTAERDRMLARKGLPPLPAIPAMPGTARWRAALGQARALLGQTHDEMDAYVEDRSDQWHETERAEMINDALDAIAEIVDTIDQVQLQ